MFTFWIIVVKSIYTSIYFADVTGTTPLGRAVTSRGRNMKGRNVKGAVT